MICLITDDVVARLCPRLDAAELRHYTLVQGGRVRSGEKDFAAHGNLRQC